MQDIEALFTSIQKAPDPEMLNHFLKGTLSNLQDIVKKLDCGEKLSEDAMMARREDIGTVLSLVERTTQSLATNVKAIDSNGGEMGSTSASDIRGESSKGGMTMDNLQADFFEAAREVLGDSMAMPVKNGKIGAIIEELDSVKQKYTDAVKSQEVMQKEIEFLKISLWSHTSDAGLLAKNLDMGNIDLSKLPNEFRVNTSKADEPNNNMAMGKMWEEMQRLQALVNILEEEKRAQVSNPASLPEEPKPQNSVPPPPPPPPPRKLFFKISTNFL